MYDREAFAKKYNATAFDENDRLNVLAENARRAVISAFLENDQGGALNGEEAQCVIAGLLVGVACVAASHFEQTDQSHAAVRSEMIQMAPWAVDMMRQIGDAPMPPLSDNH